MEEKYRRDQIEKAQKKEKVIRAWLDGRQLSELMRGSELKLSRTQWWTLKKKYREKGPFRPLL